MVKVELPGVMETASDPSPGDIESIVGAAGGPSGVTAVDRALALPVPIELMAETLNL